MSDQKIDPDADIEIEAGRFVVKTNVQQQKLFVTLRDKISKKLFNSSFTSTELELCGFNQGQASKLEAIGKLIQAAQNRENGCKLIIKIPQDNAKDGGMQGVMNSIPGFRHAEVIISREDAILGSTSYTLKLDEITRDATDVNAESIEDIIEDVNYMREQIATLTADLSVAQQHRLPKGAIIDWYGARKNIPNFWAIHEADDDNKDGDEEEAEGSIVKDIFTYESDFDENGIIYALATAYGTKDWENPSESGELEVRTAARMARASKPKHFIISHESNFVTYIEDAEFNWFTIDFKKVSIKPTNYTLRHDAAETNEFHLRNWQLQGSNDGDGDTWDVLLSHDNDEALNEPNGTSTWTIPNITTFYRYFRVKMTGPCPKTQRWFLCCSGFEIYGEIKREDDDGGAPKRKYTLIKTV